MVSQRHVIVLGIENFLADEIPEVRFAEKDAEELALLLPRVGYPSENLVCLLGPKATKSSIESRLRKLAKSMQSGDELFIFYFGQGLSFEEQSLLLMYDSQLEDLAGTALALGDLWSQFATRGIHLRCLFDVGLLEVENHQEFVSHFNEDELDLLIQSYPESLLILSSGLGQPSQFAASLHHRLWGHHLLQAFSGEASLKKMGKDRLLTSELLWNYLKMELPRTARKILATPTKQNPAHWGSISEKIIFADLNQQAATEPSRPSIHLHQLKRIVFRAQTTGKVKELKGYQKGHRLPEQVSPSAKKFVARIAMEDIREEIEETFNQLREHLGFKRKDLEATAEKEGLGFIRTPVFDYTLQASLDGNDPGIVHWLREITHIQDPELLRSPGFQSIFGTTFDTLHFEFNQPISLIDFVDEFEESPIKGVRLRTSIDGSSCELTLDGFIGTLRLEPNGLTISGRSASPGSLIDQFFEFQRRFSQESQLLALT